MPHRPIERPFVRRARRCIARVACTLVLSGLLAGCALLDDLTGAASGAATSGRPEGSPPQARTTPPVLPPATSVDAASVDAARVDPAPDAIPSAVYPRESAAARQPTVVGLLLPLSGPAAALGRGMQKAAELALFDAPDSGLVLMTRDTRGEPGGAAAATAELLAAGARLVIGPVFAEPVSAAAGLSRPRGVPLIAFSNDLAVAAPGVFLMGYPPDDQVERLVAFAAQRGVRRMATLAPQNAYGLAAGDAADFWSTQWGIDLVAGRWIPDAAHGRELAAAVAAFAAEIRELGFGERDAVLLPFPGERLLEIAPLLAREGVDARRVMLMGTETWEHPGLTREPALAGALYAAPSPEGRLAFRTRFREVFGEPPPRVATLAYDAVALAAVLANRPPALADDDLGYGGRGFDRNALTTPQGFVGADGLFRFRPEGPTERSFAVLVVDPAGPRIMEEPAERFASMPGARSRTARVR